MPTPKGAPTEIGRSGGGGASDNRPIQVACGIKRNNMIVLCIVPMIEAVILSLEHTPFNHPDGYLDSLRSVNRLIRMPRCTRDSSRRVLLDSYLIPGA